MKKQNEKGKRFSELASRRGIKASIAAQLNFENAVINNWRYRGVPAEYAYFVADILGCAPIEISDIKTPLMPAEQLEEARRLLPTIDDALRLIYAERHNLRAADLAAMKAILDQIDRFARARLDNINHSDRGN